MRILLLADEFGGTTLDPAGLWLAELARACRRRGHGLEVVCSAAGAEPGRSDPWPGLVVRRTDAASVDLVLAEALASRPQVVHVAAPGPFNARVLEALADFPLMLDLHDHWPICPHFDLLRRPAGEACDRHHPFEGCVACAGRTRVASMADRAALAACARVIVAHDEPTRQRVAAALGREVLRFDYGVDTLRFAPLPAPAPALAVAGLAAARHGARVLVLGPPTAARGAGRLIDLLVALSARVLGVEMVVTGVDPDDPERGGWLREEARLLGLESQLRLVPTVPSDELPALIGACDVAVSPGLAPDPGGLFPMLASACGVPVVAHASGDRPASFAAHDGAMTADARDIGAFAHKVAAVLSDPVERARRGDAARLAAIEAHDLEPVMVTLEALWQRLAAPGASAHAA